MTDLPSRILNCTETLKEIRSINEKDYLTFLISTKQTKVQIIADLHRFLSLKYGKSSLQEVVAFMQLSDIRDTVSSLTQRDYAAVQIDRDFKGKTWKFTGTHIIDDSRIVEIQGTYLECYIKAYQQKAMIQTHEII